MFVFRIARQEDAQSIADFQVAMAMETEDLQLDPSVCLKGVRAVLEKASLGKYYVAEQESRVVGVTLTTYEWSDWRNGIVWWIQSVYVHPEFRKQGIYSGIYAFIRGLAQSDPSVRGIRLYVDKRNVAAQQVYS